MGQANNSITEYMVFKVTCKEDVNIFLNCCNNTLCKDLSLPSTLASEVNMKLKCVQFAQFYCAEFISTCY